MPCYNGMYYYYEVKQKYKDSCSAWNGWQFNTEYAAWNYVNRMDTTPFEYSEIFCQTDDPAKIKEQRKWARVYDDLKMAEEFKEVKDNERRVIEKVSIRKNKYGKYICKWKEALWYET